MMIEGITRGAQEESHIGIKGGISPGILALAWITFIRLTTRLTIRELPTARGIEFRRVNLIPGGVAPALVASAMPSLPNGKNSTVSTPTTMDSRIFRAYIMAAGECSRASSDMPRRTNNVAIMPMTREINTAMMILTVRSLRLISFIMRTGPL